MPQKTFITHRSKATSADKTINGKTVTQVTDDAFIKSIHNNFAAGKTGSAANYGSPKNTKVAFENEYILLDLNAIDVAAAASFGSALTGTTASGFIDYINGLDHSTL